MILGSLGRGYFRKKKRGFKCFEVANKVVKFVRNVGEKKKKKPFYYLLTFTGSNFFISLVEL